MLATGSDRFKIQQSINICVSAWLGYGFHGILLLPAMHL